MKLWLSRNSEVPIQEQLSTQLILGIVSADLLPGERLPSTSELARKFRVHANTVRASYRELARRGWLEWRPGSGFYVRPRQAPNDCAPHVDLDRLISAFLSTARLSGYSLDEIQSRIDRWLSLQPPDHILVIDPDPELRMILASELKQKTSVRVESAGFEACSRAERFVGALCVALYDHAREVQSALPPEAPCILLRSTSIQKSMAGRARPPKDTLLTVISRWPDFLHWARTTLVAVGIDPAALDIRDARSNGWERGLTPQSFIITDSLVAGSLPQGCRPNIFYIIADESIGEIQAKMKGT